MCRHVKRSSLTCYKYSTPSWQSIMRKVTWRRFNQSAKQLVVGQTTIPNWLHCLSLTLLGHMLPCTDVSVCYNCQPTFVKYGEITSMKACAHWLFDSSICCMVAQDDTHCQVKRGCAMVWNTLNSYWLHTRTDNHLTALSAGLPGWAGTRRNIHPLTPILIIKRPLSTSSI